MVANGNEKCMEEYANESGSSITTCGDKANSCTLLDITTSQNGFRSYENHPTGLHGTSTTTPSRVGFLKFGSAGSLASPSANSRQVAEEGDNVSRTVPYIIRGVQERINRGFVQKFDWVSIQKICNEWIRNPMNMALFAWITCVAVSGAILFLVMTGMLNNVLKRKSQRDTWFEVNNQILNALFTLMCLCHHPKRFHHLVLLCRWRSDDISSLRKIYCKNGTYKPNERAHMMVVVALLHVNCFAQYALCGLNLGFKRSDRPALGVGICISLAIAAPAIAGVYCIVSPLGREYECEMDEEAHNQIISVEIRRPNQLRMKSLEKRLSFASRDDPTIVENRPKWKGGLFDFWDDISVACLSLLCSFCVFGWNMERLGFGNMYVHIATFLMFCTAPFWIFNLAAVNIDNEVVREALGITGVLLCMFGLLYGGFWRIQMRKRFNLPANYFCCGRPAIADCTLWLFCYWCSLAQEVRTVDFYGVVENKFCRKHMDENGQLSPPHLPHEGGMAEYGSGPSSPLWDSSRATNHRTTRSQSPSKVSKMNYSPDRHLLMVEEKSSSRVNENAMAPPVLLSMQKQDCHSESCEIAL